MPGASAINNKPACILLSVLTNTSQLTQRTPGQPGWQSTGCRVNADTGWPVKGEHAKSGDIQTNQKLVTVASGRDHATSIRGDSWRCGDSWRFAAIRGVSLISDTGVGRARFDMRQIIMEGQEK